MVLVERLDEGLMLAVFGEDSPDDKEWKVYMKVMEKLQIEDRILILSAGGGPGLMQRRELEQLTRGHKGRVAVVTVSRAARGIVTALSWFDRNIKAFDPKQVTEAFKFLDVKAYETRGILRRARAMADTLGVLDRIAI